MSTRLSVSSRESVWNEHKDSLKRTRDHKGNRNGNAPASTQHRLPNHNRKRTPPTLARLDTPEDHRHGGKVRGSRYGVVPPLPAFSDDGDSWGEEGESEEDEPVFPAHPVPGYQAQYPVVMYPMMMPVPQPSPRSKKKGTKPKKKVRYRNTPMYFDREKSNHRSHDQPHRSYDNQNHRSPVTFNPQDDLPPALTPYRSYSKHNHNYDKKRFNYISPHMGVKDYDPFDPRSNSVLARYSYPARSIHEEKYSNYRGHPSLGNNAQYRHFIFSDGFDKQFTDDFTHQLLDEVFIPELAKDFTIEEGLRNNPHPVTYNHNRHSTSYKVMEDVAEDLLEEVVIGSSLDVVRGVAQDLVTQHLHSAIMRDFINELIDDIIIEDGQVIAQEVNHEVMLEDLIDEVIICPETDEVARDVAMETCEKANNKFRRQEIKVLNRSNGERQQDSLILDYLLAKMARQRHVGSESEHAQRLQDDMMLTVLIEQLLDVEHRRRQTVACKPIRRLHEKAATDVALEVLLGELGRSLTEDLADLDEYEQGVQNPDVNRESTEDFAKFQQVFRSYWQEGSSPNERTVVALTS